MFSVTPIRVILASKSQIKIDAVTKALNDPVRFQVIPIVAASDVNEQPFDLETITGALNRVDNAVKEYNNGDIYIAIENGIFEESDGRIMDKAVIWIRCRTGYHSFKDSMYYSESVEFPRECYDKAKARGFDKTVVADIMVEDKIVESRDDPHKSLGQKRSRVDILIKALVQVDIAKKYIQANGLDLGVKLGK